MQTLNFEAAIGVTLKIDQHCMPSEGFYLANPALLTSGAIEQERDSYLQKGDL